MRWSRSNLTEGPKVADIGRGRVHVVLGRRSAPPPSVGVPCRCRGVRACSCRSAPGPVSPDERATAWNAFAGDRPARSSYSLEELTRLSYAYEELEHDHRRRVEALYLADRARAGGRRTPALRRPRCGAPRRPRDPNDDPLWAEYAAATPDAAVVPLEAERSSGPPFK